MDEMETGVNHVEYLTWEPLHLLRKPNNQAIEGDLSIDDHLVRKIKNGLVLSLLKT